MGTSSKAGKGKRREGKKKGEIPEHILASRQRLRDALSLGIKFYDDKRRKWQCWNAEIMGHAVRTMSAFVGCICSDLLQHPLIKDSVSDMLVALEGILQSENETVLGPATNVTEKLFRTLGSSKCQYHYSDTILPLLNLLSFHQSTVVIGSAVSLRCILTNLGSCSREDGIWDNIQKTKAIKNIIHILLDCIAGFESTDYFIKIASLLREILWRWPPSRYQVWNNTELMTGLVTFCANSDPSVVVSILQLYSSLALCGDVANMLLNSADSHVSEMVLYIHPSQPINVRTEALILCGHLTRSEKGCNLLTSLCCEPLVQGIINAMGGWRSLQSRKVPMDQMPLVTAACHAALITCWPGGHHPSFWKLGIDNVLLDLLLGNCKGSYRLKDPDELRVAVYDNISDIRNYIWDILGWLAMHCDEGFHFQTEEKRKYLDTLIHCACLVAVDLMFMRSPSQHHFIFRSFCTSEAEPVTFQKKSEVEPVSRAVMMMVLSPCKYIASRTRTLLWEVMSFNDNDYLDCLLGTLKLNYVDDESMASDNLQTVVNLMSLVYYSSLPQYQGLIFERKGIETIIAIIDRCLKGDIHVSRSSIASHLYSSNAKTCCLNYVPDWERGNIILLYSLQALSQLICFFGFTRNDLLRRSGQISLGNLCDNDTAQSLFCNLQQIINSRFSHEFKWYASYCLSSFGFYGFPSKLGKRMAGTFIENELADLQIILSNGQNLGVHGVILVARCPALLPSNDFSLKNETSADISSEKESSFQQYMRSRHVIHLSNHVDNDALVKLLEYVYTGYCQVDDSIVKPLLVLAKRCNMESLYYMLKQRQPRCRSPIPKCDFSQLLALAERPFTDITLEAKGGVEIWNCSTCQLSFPHMHVHKIMLCSSSPYMRALFQSGMRESHSRVIKVPICWEALVKLVTWFYSGELPKLEFQCAWNNMDSEQQFKELLVYVELSWLADFWCLDDVHKESLEVVTSCFNTSKKFPLKIVESALNLGQQRIVEAAVSSLAPLYPRMRDARDLEGVDEEVVRMLQSEYVHYSQGSQRLC